MQLVDRNVSYELIPALTKTSKKPMLVAQWQKVDGKLICKWTTYTN